MTSARCTRTQHARTHSQPPPPPPPPHNFHAFITSLNGQTPSEGEEGRREGGSGGEARERDGGTEGRRAP